MSNSNTKPLSAAKRKAMVEDLFRKYPYGPKGKKRGYKKDDYSVSNRWSSHHGGYRMLVNLRSAEEGETFGYSNLDIYKLNLGDCWDIRNYIEEEFSPISRMAANKRANRIWVRIMNARSDIRQNGATGIYKVWWHHDRAAYVHANSVSDAQVYAEMMLKVPLGGNESHYEPRVDFRKVGDAVMLADLNHKETSRWVSTAQDHVDSLRKRLAQAEGDLEKLQSSAQMVNSLSGYQIAESLEEEL